MARQMDALEAQCEEFLEALQREIAPGPTCAWFGVVSCRAVFGWWCGVCMCACVYKNACCDAVTE